MYINAGNMHRSCIIIIDRQAKNINFYLGPSLRAHLVNWGTPIIALYIYTMSYNIKWRQENVYFRLY